MKRLTALTLTLALIGCSELPKEVRDTGERFTRTYKGGPAVAAGCIGRTLEEHNVNITTSTRALDELGLEVLIRIPSLGRTLAVGELRPQGSQSSAVIWLTPNAMLGREQLVDLLKTRC